MACTPAGQAWGPRLCEGDAGARSIHGQVYGEHHVAEPRLDLSADSSWSQGLLRTKSALRCKALQARATDAFQLCSCNSVGARTAAEGHKGIEVPTSAPWARQVPLDLAPRGL